MSTQHGLSCCRYEVPKLFSYARWGLTCWSTQDHTIIGSTDSAALPAEPNSHLTPPQNEFLRGPTRSAQLTIHTDQPIHPTRCRQHIRRRSLGIQMTLTNGRSAVGRREDAHSTNSVRRLTSSSLKTTQAAHFQKNPPSQRCSRNIVNYT